MQHAEREDRRQLAIREREAARGDAEPDEREGELPLRAIRAIGEPDRHARRELQHREEGGEDPDE